MKKVNIYFATRAFCGKNSSPTDMVVNVFDNEVKVKKFWFPLNSDIQLPYSSIDLSEEQINLLINILKDAL